MPLKNGRLTPQEKAFIEPMARTGDRAYAAYKAGLSQPEAAGSQLMARPAVRAEVVRRAEAILFDELLPKALRTLSELMEPIVPAGARLGATKLAIERTLGVQQADAAEKEPSEMTYDELQSQIARLKREQDTRAEGALDVTPEPDIEPHSIMD